MNLTTWNPVSVIIVLLVGLPSATYAIIAIISAVKGNAAAAQQAADSMRGLAQQAALEALQKTGLPRQVTELGSQMQQIALQTPPPQPAQTVVAVTPVEVQK